MGQSEGGPTVTLEREENVASKSLYNYLFNLKLAFLSLFVSFILFIFIDHKYCTLYSRNVQYTQYEYTVPTNHNKPKSSIVHFLFFAGLEGSTAKSLD